MNNGVELHMNSSGAFAVGLVESFAFGEGLLKRCKPTGLRISVNSRHRIIKKITLRQSIIKLLNTRGKKKTNYEQRNKNEDLRRFFIGNNKSKKIGKQSPYLKH